MQAGVHGAGVHGRDGVGAGDDGGVRGLGGSAQGQHDHGAGAAGEGAPSRTSVGGTGVFRLVRGHAC